MKAAPPFVNTHPHCRPGRTAKGTRALQLRANGLWCEDNGEPARAFIGLAVDWINADVATIWIADCSCKAFNKCPLAKALERVADGDDYTGASVVRRRAVAVKLRYIDRVRRRH